MFGIGLEVHTLQFSWTFVPRKFHGLFETKKLGWFKLCIPTEGILYLWYQACYALVKVQRADLMCDVIKKLAPFVLSKLWILIADWLMRWSHDMFLIKLRLYSGPTLLTSNFLSNNHKILLFFWKKNFRLISRDQNFSMHGGAKLHR